MLAQRAEPARAAALLPAVAQTSATPGAPAVDPVITREQPAPPTNDAEEWFRQVKPLCNSVEVASTLLRSPPPSGVPGTGYQAACLALAGKIDDARSLIEAIDADGQRVAASILFEVGHPVADAGDDRSAGPIMELVVHYLPDHYMALYHAGMAQYVLGEREDAKRNLESFLRIYVEKDGWRSNALGALDKLSDGANVDAVRRAPPEPSQ